MAFPFVFESNFETGDTSEWTSSSGSKISIAHYTTLANITGSAIPYGGAYAMLVDVRAGTGADQIVTSTTIAIADGATGYFRFYLHASKDFTATVDDTFNILELQQAGGATTEITLGMRVTAASNLLEIGVGDGVTPTSFVPFTRGMWTCVEMLATVSTVGAGVITLFLDGGQVITLTGKTQAAAVGQGQLGLQLTFTTTTGCLVFDQFVMDDARVYPIRNRFPTSVDITKTQHIFVGPGTLSGAAISSTTSDNTATFYDTDAADITRGQSRVAALSNAGLSGIDGPVFFEKGCYVVLGGTSPCVAAYLSQSSEKPGVHGPERWSDGSIRQYAFKRKA